MVLKKESIYVRYSIAEIEAWIQGFGEAGSKDAD